MPGGSGWRSAVARSVSRVSSLPFGSGGVGSAGADEVAGGHGGAARGNVGAGVRRKAELDAVAGIAIQGAGGGAVLPGDVGGDGLACAEDAAVNAEADADAGRAVQTDQCLIAEGGCGRGSCMRAATR